jgi:hypothetical protein
MPALPSPDTFSPLWRVASYVLAKHPDTPLSTPLFLLFLWLDNVARKDRLSSRTVR